MSARHDPSGGPTGRGADRTAPDRTAATLQGDRVRQLVSRTEAAIDQLQRELAHVVAEAERVEREVVARGGPDLTGGATADRAPEAPTSPSAPVGPSSPMPPTRPPGPRAATVRANGASGSVGDGVPVHVPRTVVDRRDGRGRWDRSRAADPEPERPAPLVPARAAWFQRVGSTLAFRTGVVLVVVALLLLWRG